MMFGLGNVCGNCMKGNESFFQIWTNLWAAKWKMGKGTFGEL